MVETGKLSRVARKLVSAAPSATARRKFGDCVSASGARPLPLNAESSPRAAKSAVIAPAKVVAVPHHSAVRRLVVPLP